MASPTQVVLDRLAAFESRNVTYVDPAGGWPIVWERARDCQVWDVEGRRYLDLTAAFGVAAAGHANPAVVRAGQRQMSRLLHAMGDVHPHALKAELAETLSELTWGRWTASARREASGEATPARGKVIFGNSGFEAVEAALKTARLATGRPGIIAFQGAYHGLGYGALNATERDLFREPFRNQLREFGVFVNWPASAGEGRGRLAEDRRLEQVERDVRHAFRRRPIGAILVEPVQARGGIRIPPPGFLSLLRRLATEHHALLIVDEIYTGFGRTGRWFACEHSGVIPDLICLGKALTGGFPLSACVGRADLMDCWPSSQGEAIHTSTFLGHPVGCAMALAQVAELRRQALPDRSARLGVRFLRDLQALPAPAGSLRVEARGLGLMAGLELRTKNGQPASAESLALVKWLLARGLIVLPEGEHGEVVSFTPPLTIRATDLDRTVAVLGEGLGEVGGLRRRRVRRKVST